MSQKNPFPKELDEARKYRAYMRDPTVSDSVIIKRYTETSLQYEQIMAVRKYSGPLATAAALAKLFPKNRDIVNILDIAAGTGLCAIECHKYGFRKMDALDPSKGMLEEAKKKNLYRNFIKAVLGDSTLDIDDNTYDAVTICGLCTNIMIKIPNKALEELIRITKSGGFIILAGDYTTFTEAAESSKAFRQKMKFLETEGKWMQVEVRQFSDYLDGEDGAVCVHVVC